MARTPDPLVDARIHRAAVSVLRRDGLGGLTIDAVAAEAGVGRAAIYRRYRSKEELVVGAVRAELPVVAPTGELQGPAALAAIVEDLRVALFEAGGAALLPLLLTDESDDLGVGRLWRRDVVGPRVALIGRVLRATPETRGADARLIAELTFGGLLARRISRGPISPVDARDLAADLWALAARRPRTNREDPDAEEDHDDDHTG